MSATNVAHPRHGIGFCNVMRMGYVLGPPGTSPTVQLPELRSAASSGAGPRVDRPASGTAGARPPSPDVTDVGRARQKVGP
jgi:hypothetical protein